MRLKIIKNTESGRSMLEIIGVLAIMTLMSAGAFIMIRSSMATQRRNTVVDDFSKIVTGVRTLYSDYDDLTVFDGEGAMAAMGIDKNKTPYNNATYSVTRVGNGKDGRFDVKISGLPNKDCIVLARRSWPDSIGKSSSCPKSGSQYVSVTYRK